jgi:GNAT superfamily N-acetyltransferase
LKKSHLPGKEELALSKQETFPMINLIPVRTDEHKQHVKELFLEYMEFVRQNLVQVFEFASDFEAAPYVDEDMNKLDKLLPPQGQLLLVEVDGQIAGLGGLRQIGESMGEIKRMYVRPNFQSRGLGCKLLEALIAEALQIGYSKLRLDVGFYATSAEKLYRSVGFTEIDPYPESEALPEIHSKWTFMEMSLQGD